MRFWRFMGLLMLTLGIIAEPVHAADAKPQQAKTPKSGKGSTPERRAWMFGISPGYGGSRFVGNWKTLVAEVRSDTPAEYPILIERRPDWVNTQIEPAKTLQYRVGYAVNPRLMLGFERAQWFKDFGDYSWRFKTSLLSATFYPGDMHLFVRGGAGISAMAEKVPLVAPLYIQAADRGFGLEGALGFEWSLFKRVSIAPELALRTMTFSEEVRAQMCTASVGFNWWF